MQCVDLGGRRIIKKRRGRAGGGGGGSRKEDNFFQAEDGIRDVERSRGLGDVYKRQPVVKQYRPLPSSITCLGVVS